MKEVFGIAAVLAVIGGFVYGAVRAVNAQEAREEREKIESREGPCQDTSWLLATTSGSPNSATCPNKRHRMRVQIATTASNEEVGAIVFCECDRGEDSGR